MRCTERPDSHEWQTRTANADVFVSLFSCFSWHVTFVIFAFPHHTLIHICTHAPILLLRTHTHTHILSAHTHVLCRARKPIPTKGHTPPAIRELIHPLPLSPVTCAYAAPNPDLAPSRGGLEDLFSKLKRRGTKNEQVV